MTNHTVEAIMLPNVSGPRLYLIKVDGIDILLCGKNLVYPIRRYIMTGTSDMKPSITGRVRKLCMKEGIEINEYRDK